MKKTLCRMLFWHAVIALLALLLSFGFRSLQLIGRLFPTCLLHDVFHLYCPFCGGTRAVVSMLRLDFSTALVCNPPAVLLFLFLLVCDGIAWVRVMRGKTPWFAVSKWVWIGFLILFGLFFLARNLLLVKFGVDPVGDLLRFWK